MVLAFGYVVAMGPVGFYSLWAKDLVGDVPWNVYSLASIAIIAGLTHVPHVYLYSSTAALQSLGSDVEEAAHMAGSSPLQVARDVSLRRWSRHRCCSPVCWSSSSASRSSAWRCRVLGDPEGHLVLATYLFKPSPTSSARRRIT